MMECSIALRCLVEHKKDAAGGEGSAESIQKFAIVPNSIKVSGLLQFVLQCLDVKANLPDCTASILLPNWKALSLAEVCEDPENTSAATLLSQVSNIAVFKIELPVPETTVLPSHLIRNLLKSLIMHQAGGAGVHISWFKQAGCPLTELALENFLKSPEDYEFPLCERKAFSDWHSRMCLQYLEQVSKAPSLYHMPFPLMPPLSDGLVGNGQQSSDDDSRGEDLRQPAFGLLTQQQPQQLLKDSRGNKMRMTFDPDVELPLLQQWFAMNSHPSREQMEQYRTVLNQLPLRRNRRQLDLANIVYWFKNMRANEKRLSCPTVKVEEEAGSSEVEQEDEQTLPSDEERSGKENSEVLGLSAPWGLTQAPTLLRSPSNSFLGSVQSEADAGSPAADTSGSVSAKRRRTRVFIDPVTEIPQLESWFSVESHPTSAQFHQFASILNSMPFRQKQPCLEAKNIQLWFKNHRAKVKRERLDASVDNNAEASAMGDGGFVVPQSPAGDSDAASADAKSKEAQQSQEDMSKETLPSHEDLSKETLQSHEDVPKEALQFLEDESKTEPQPQQLATVDG